MNAIGTNIAAMRAGSAFRNADRLRAAAAERLATGSRIGSARDDAAGLSIATGMTSRIRGQAQAIRNIADGMSLARTAQGALEGMATNLQRIRELAVQSANGTIADDQRAFLQEEVTMLREQAMSLMLDTRFNGRQLFGESTPLPAPAVGYFWGPSTITIQTGSEAGDTATSAVSLAFLPVFDVSTRAGALQALTRADGSLLDMGRAAAEYGAFENRLASAAEIAQGTATSLSDARSRIMDADYSSETMHLAKQTVLANASSSMLASANMQARNVLALLR